MKVITIIGLIFLVSMGVASTFTLTLDPFCLPQYSQNISGYEGRTFKINHTGWCLGIGATYHPSDLFSINSGIVYGVPFENTQHGWVTVEEKYEDIGRIEFYDSGYSYTSYTTDFTFHIKPSKTLHIPITVGGGLDDYSIWLKGFVDTDRITFVDHNLSRRYCYIKSGLEINVLPNDPTGAVWFNLYIGVDYDILNHQYALPLSFSFRFCNKEGGVFPSWLECLRVQLEVDTMLDVPLYALMQAGIEINVF